jgi:hypothetical protein
MSRGEVLNLKFNLVLEYSRVRRYPGYTPTDATAVYTAVLNLATIVLQGRRARKGYLVTRITVTLSIFNFSMRFFAQIVENRETQLSSPFLGPGDNFSKNYYENQICSGRHGYGAAGRGSDAQISGAIQLPYKSVFVITFRKIVPRT